ncbi:MAG: glycosyltransferase [Chlorobium sp.]|nr:glycosyltransferase [Chlorobium sp.]
MNILFLNSIGRSKFGGGEKWMVNAAIGLKKLGHNVVLGSKKNSKTLNYAASHGVNTVIFEIRSDFSPLNTLKIALYLKRHAIDVMICNLNKDVRVAGLAARLYGKTTVLARHGMLLCGNKWKHKLTLSKLVNGIITNSNTIKKAYADYGWFSDNFVKVLYNGITIPDDVPSFDFSSRFPDKIIIYSAGRISEQKGFTYLIEAAAILKETRGDLLFAISGEGRLEADLKKQVAEAGMEDSFIFMGFTDNIYPYIKGCDLFVLASLFEGMPNVVMEAMAMKKPVIATDVNGARELMVEGETGIIIPPKNPTALATAIGSIIDNPGKLEQFGRAGYERVIQEFAMAEMIKKLERYLQEKIREKKRNQSDQ